MAQLKEFRTEDPDSFKEAMSPVAPVKSIQGLRRKSFYAKAKLVRLPRIGLFSVEMKNGRVLAERPCGFLGLTVPLDRPFEVANRKEVQSIGPGSAHCLNASDAFDLRTPHRTQMLVATLFPSLLNSYAAKLNGGEQTDEIQLNDCISLQTPAGSGLWRLLNFLWGEANRSESLLGSDLMTRELEDALFSSLIFVAEEQGRNVLRPQEAYCQPAYLRRAEEYIAAHLTKPVSLGDIAHVAGVSVRTLTRAFGTRYDTGPIAFLKRLRLECAQRELLGADPHRKTVTNIAVKYGFWDLGKFAFYYREAFGEIPSQTLRR